jgi:hypothetical protein
MILIAFDIGNKSDTAGIPFKSGIIEAILTHKNNWLSA